MKIQCQSCQAKYTIADEKVVGKVVKIRCKKCSATIVINGNEQAAPEDNAETHVFDYASQSNEQWTVNVADGDQRTMTSQEIANEYRTGVINDETYCWKDGMADWLPLREIEQLYGAVKVGSGRGGSAEDISVPPQSIPQPAAASPLFAASDVAHAVDSPFAGGAPPRANGNGSAGLFGGGAVEAAAQPAAARRGGGRGQGADLFGNVEKAGGEDDVMTSAAKAGAANAAAAASAGADQKLTGQRNESSVLFSLNALTSDAKKEAPRGGPENRTTAGGDGSGLIDIRALSANMGDDKKESKARVDDIMNLSGGGAFGAALAAPILAPPPLEVSDHGGGTSGGKSNMVLIAAILGAALLIAVGIVVAVVISTRPSGPVASPLPTGSLADPTSTGPVAMTDPTGTAGGSTAAATGNDTTPPPPGTGATKASPATPATHAGHNPGAVAANPGQPAAKPADPPAKPPPATPAQPGDFNGALAAAAGKPANTPPPAAAPASTQPFDRGAAAASLGSVNVQSCKKPDGPTGSGHVTVTFSPDGSVASAVVDSGPFPGTAVGGCIAGKYRGARVPAFSGAPVRVGKSFSIN